MEQRDRERMLDRIGDESVSMEETLEAMKGLLGLPTTNGEEAMNRLMTHIDAEDEEGSRRYEEAFTDSLRIQLLKAWYVGTMLIQTKSIRRNAREYGKWVRTAGGEKEARDLGCMVANLCKYQLISYTGVPIDSLMSKAIPIRQHLERNPSCAEFWSQDPKKFFGDSYKDDMTI